MKELTLILVTFLSSTVKTAGFYILNVDENLDVALLCHFYCAILKTLHNFKVEELTTEQIGLFSFKMFKYSKFLKTT